MISFSIVSVSVATKYLFRLSPYTYAKTTHGDFYLAYLYHGEISVRGKDRIRVVGDTDRWVRWVSITYDVQGNITEAHVYSGNQNNPNQIIKKVTVRDRWDSGPVTKFSYNYGTSRVYVPTS